MSRSVGHCPQHHHDHDHGYHHHRDRYHHRHRHHPWNATQVGSIALHCHALQRKEGSIALHCHTLQQQVGIIALHCHALQRQVGSTRWVSVRSLSESRHLAPTWLSLCIGDKQTNKQTDKQTGQFECHRTGEEGASLINQKFANF